MEEYIRETLTALTLSYGPTGREKSTAEVIIRYLSHFTGHISKDTAGNILARIPASVPNPKKILIDAHYDEIAMIVTKIDDRGFIYFDCAIGTDKRTLLSTEVNIHGKNEVYGIVAIPPIHMLSKEETSKIPEIGRLCIDTGFSAEKVKRLIRVGDLITHKANTYQLLNGLFAGKSMDNRAGVCAVLTCLNLLKGKHLPFELNILFSTQEENNLSGGKVGAYSIDPDIAIVLDVTFAKSFASKDETLGVMADGPMVGFAPILNRKISVSLMELAEKAAIPCQKEIMNGNTGTNSAVIHISGMGVPTGLISIPLRYMHSQCEVVSSEDIDASARLLSAFLQA